MLGLDIKNFSGFSSQLSVGSPQTKKKIDRYELLVGKNKNVRIEYNELILPLTNKSNDRNRLNIVVRAFNDGIAFRYEMNSLGDVKTYEVSDELTEFNFLGNPKTYGLLFGNTYNSHEGLYRKIYLNQLPSDSLLDMPALFVFSDSVYLAITEAKLRNYAGMYLKRKGAGLTSYLSPLPGHSGIKVKARVPHSSPWRVLLLSDRLNALLESEIISSLNDPPAFRDLSWIKPGKTSFHWWNGDIVPDTSFEPGANFLTNKYYIDFCSQYGIEYHSVIGYAGRPWYVNDGGYNYQPGTGTDVTRTIPSIDIKQISDYASKKGVGIHVWVHWKALYPKLDTAFGLFEKWGIKGMMVDFMDRDDQEMVNIQEEILKKAAAHRLFIQFHGSFKPTGLHRTYPNEFTREGTYNYEQNKWAVEGVTAHHDLDIVFTRLLAGAADYHLGGFRSVNPAAFRPQFTRPLMRVTRSHSIAMYVVLESYFNMVADYPDAYRGQDGFDFITAVPTTWDESKVISATLESHVVFARRKGDIWYVGGINNSKGKTIPLSFDFLPAGQFQADVISDVYTDPNKIGRKKMLVDKHAGSEIYMADSGGFVMKLEIVKNNL